MATYADLQPGMFYLLQDKPQGDISFVSVLAYSDQCVLLRSFGKVEVDFWRKKSDGIHELVEELDFESAASILSLYDEGDEDDLEELDEEWEENWEDDEDDEDK